MEKIKTNTLKPGLSFTGDLYIDNLFLLVPHTAHISEDLIKALKLWQFETLELEGKLSLGGDIGLNTLGDENEIIVSTPKEKLGSSIKKVIEDSKSINIANNEALRLDMVKNVYNEYANYIESLYTHYATHKEINQEELSETVQELCIFVKENRRFILRILSELELNKNFLISHSLKTTIFSIAIALQLHMTLSKMIELGIACILHEIGMLQLPPQIYMGTRQLTPGEKAMISKHPVFGYSILKDMGFPLTIQLGTLEHHEKENGTGYPRRLTGDKISPIAKIISVACSYEAITSKRNYKSERSTFEAILEMLSNNNKIYDEKVTKALLHTVSLYPIGTYVYLQNRKIAIVTDTNPNEPKYPTVQLVTEREPDGSPKIVHTNLPETAILRVLTKQEKADVLKIVEEKYKLIEEAQKMAEVVNQKIQQNKVEKQKITSGTSLNKIETEEVDISFFN